MPRRERVPLGKTLRNDAHATSRLGTKRTRVTKRSASRHFGEADKLARLRLSSGRRDLARRARRGWRRRSSMTRSRASRRRPAVCWRAPQGSEGIAPRCAARYRETFLQRPVCVPSLGGAPVFCMKPCLFTARALWGFSRLPCAQGRAQRAAKPFPVDEEVGAKRGAKEASSVGVDAGFGRGYL